MTHEINFRGLVEGIVRNTAEAKVPVLPGPIADTLIEVFTNRMSVVEQRKLATEIRAVVATVVSEHRFREAKPTELLN